MKEIDIPEHELYITGIEPTKMSIKDITIQDLRDLIIKHDIDFDEYRRAYERNMMRFVEALNIFEVQEEIKNNEFEDLKFRMEGLEK